MVPHKTRGKKNSKSKNNFLTFVSKSLHAAAEPILLCCTRRTLNYASARKRGKKKLVQNNFFCFCICKQVCLCVCVCVGVCVCLYVCRLSLVVTFQMSQTKDCLQSGDSQVLGNVSYSRIDHKNHEVIFTRIIQEDHNISNGGGQHNFFHQRLQLSFWKKGVFITTRPLLIMSPRQAVNLMAEMITIHKTIVILKYLRIDIKISVPKDSARKLPRVTV